MRSSKRVQGVPRGSEFAPYAAKLHHAVQPQSRLRNRFPRDGPSGLFATNSDPWRTRKNQSFWARSSRANLKRPCATTQRNRHRSGTLDRHIPVTPRRGCVSSGDRRGREAPNAFKAFSGSTISAPLQRSSTMPFNHKAASGNLSTAPSLRTIASRRTIVLTGAPETKQTLRNAATRSSKWVQGVLREDNPGAHRSEAPPCGLTTMPRQAPLPAGSPASGGPGPVGTHPERARLPPRTPQNAKLSPQAPTSRRRPSPRLSSPAWKPMS